MLTVSRLACKSISMWLRVIYLTRPSSQLSQRLVTLTNPLALFIPPRPHGLHSRPLRRIAGRLRRTARLAPARLRRSSRHRPRRTVSDRPRSLLGAS